MVEFNKMPQRASSATHASTTADCHSFYTSKYWLDRVKFKLGLTVHRRLSNKGPHHPADSCTLVSNIASRQRLRSAQRCLLDVPQYNRSTLGIGHFLSPVLPSGIRFQTSSEIKAVRKTHPTGRNAQKFHCHSNTQSTGIYTLLTIVNNSDTHTVTRRLKHKKNIVMAAQHNHTKHCC